MGCRTRKRRFLGPLTRLSLERLAARGPIGPIVGDSKGTRRAGERARGPSDTAVGSGGGVLRRDGMPQGETRATV